MSDAVRIDRQVGLAHHVAVVFHGAQDASGVLVGEASQGSRAGVVDGGGDVGQVWAVPDDARERVARGEWLRYAAALHESQVEEDADGGRGRPEREHDRPLDGADHADRGEPLDRHERDREGGHRSTQQCQVADGAIGTP